MVGGQCLGVTAKSTRPRRRTCGRAGSSTPITSSGHAGSNGHRPVLAVTFDDPQVQSGWTDGKNGTRIVLDQASHKTLILPNIPEWPLLQEALDLGLSQAYIKQATPRDALGTVAQAWSLGLQAAGYGAAGKPAYTPQI